ncbi:MAG: glucose-6-phosphate isomerase [Planctomycetota bacterium]
MTDTAAPDAFTPLASDELWARYQKELCRLPKLGFSLDISRVPYPKSFWKEHEPAIQLAYNAMDDLESGAIANPDEKRMVGHYWLRAPQLAPQPDITSDLHDDFAQIKAFAADVHTKAIAPPTAAKFTDVLSIGIGGSALGPQLVSDALGNLKRRDKMAVHFIDNTDIDGIRRVIATLGGRLKSTLVLVISKSGGTPEPRNGMMEAKAAFADKGLDFAKQAVAVTGEGSHLYKVATSEGWLKTFRMYDWVGGRTSVAATVGLVPMALQGLDIDAFLAGMATMDEATRVHDTKKNPAARLALAWHFLTHGKGEKDMVILPYKDRLLLMSRYLQQLVMESLGKETDLDGNVVHQGIAVYGNKGSTDQHAYVQQLREGVNNFFATFVVVLQDTGKPGRVPIVDVNPDAEPGVDAGDYLNGFWQGTRQALYENGRPSITITFDKLDTGVVGALIALYERAVGFYATLVNINAYHQPGVEAGKKAAATVVELQSKLMTHFGKGVTDPITPDDAAVAVGEPDAAEVAHHILSHLAANKRVVAKKGKKFASL